MAGTGVDVTTTARSHATALGRRRARCRQTSPSCRARTRSSSSCSPRRSTPTSMSSPAKSARSPRAPFYLGPTLRRPPSRFIGPRRAELHAAPETAFRRARARHRSPRLSRRRTALGALQTFWARAPDRSTTTPARPPLVALEPTVSVEPRPGTTCSCRGGRLPRPSRRARPVVAVPGRPPPARAERARSHGHHLALPPPGRGLGRRRARRARDRHDRHGERENARLQPARARRDRPRRRRRARSTSIRRRRSRRTRRARSQALGIPECAPAIYDGDTPSEQRWQIRKWANVILTNPDMLHVGVLPAPRPLGRRAPEPPLRRRRRGARLPRRVRLARRRTSSAGCGGSRASTAPSRSSCSPRRRSRTRASTRAR